METEIPVRDIMTRPVITADADPTSLAGYRRPTRIQYTRPIAAVVAAEAVSASELLAKPGSRRCAVIETIEAIDDDIWQGFPKCL